MDFTDISRLISICIGVGGSIFGVVAFCIIKFNDLKHIDESLKKLDNKTDKHGDMISGLSAQVSNIEGYIKGVQEK